MKYSYITVLILVISLISCNQDDNQILKPALNQAITVYENDHFEDDYILITPMRQDTTYLIDRTGKLQQSWSNEGDEVLMAYLMKDGSVLRSIFTNADNGINIPGKTGKLQIIDKNNALVWEWHLDNSTQALHHDIALLPNGNILASVWEVIDFNMCVEAGRDPNKLFDNRLVIDKVIEIQPVGNNQANIIWEWSLWDHIIQDFDVNRSNYGDIADHPELFDVNLGAGGENYTHVNSLNYITEFDQIIINSRTLNEFFIIDHSTSTEEARTSLGGTYGKGGDILFRWGNPVNFKTGNSNDRKITGQHDASFFKSNGQFENFLVFDNLDNVEYSTVKAINVNISEIGNYPNVLDIGNIPSNVSWEYSSNSILSKLTSGCQRLRNGNILITSTAGNIIREVTMDKRVVWEYDFNQESTDEQDFKMYSNGFKTRSLSVNYSGIQSLNLEN